jgi:hypothetical protein
VSVHPTRTERWQLSRRAIRPLLQAIVLLGTVLAPSGCYVVRKPPQIDEAVRVEVVSDRGRLVQAQSSLHASISHSLVYRLGWQVSAEGSARLEIAIAKEAIDVTLRDSRGLPLQWSIRLQGTALLVCQKGNLYEHFTGQGYATGLNDQDQALQAAADNAAFALTTWLETESKHLR